jgi:hypothetical protein
MAQQLKASEKTLASSSEKQAPLLEIIQRIVRF